MLKSNKLEHVAFILDGNKRWAKKNNLTLKDAYREGLRNIHNLINNSLKINLRHLTLYTLSSENIKRTSVTNIFEVIYEDFAFFFDKIIKEKKVNINIIGSKKNLPTKILNLIDHCEENTKNNSDLFLNLAFNYGFKDEIKEVLIKINNNNKQIDFEKDSEVRSLFFMGNTVDPDILIRTGGERRLSNFIMYNLTYTEIFFINTLWPDFSFEEYLEIINNFKSISRRYGL